MIRLITLWTLLLQPTVFHMHSKKTQSVDATTRKVITDGQWVSVDKYFRMYNEEVGMVLYFDSTRVVMGFLKLEEEKQDHKIKVFIDFIENPNTVWIYINYNEPNFDQLVRMVSKNKVETYTHYNIQPIK